MGVGEASPMLDVKEKLMLACCGGGLAPNDREQLLPRWRLYVGRSRNWEIFEPGS
ncbi:hypothetical protein WMW72_31390 [Paenibacillus filicis]|uniref:Uncharacterized protein n=1 Tax=Paenibacillus filicis TaxID=669464 RepID=A0ABU9DWD2_9BACL